MDSKLSIEIEDYKEGDDDDYVNYNIVSYPSDFTLNGIKEMWENKALIIPSFQRQFVWNIKQSSLLIDSYLCGLPVPPIFLYIDENNKNLVIDGQQRIMSIIYFLDGFFGSESKQGKRQVFRLSLPHKSPYNYKTFADLDKTDQDKLLFSSVLRAINIKQLEPDDLYSSAYYIFERINTGGTPLSPQEIRNCLYHGEFLKMLRELNQDKNWRKILGRDNFDKHEKDVELILRIFSFAFEFDTYEKPMKSFLNKCMKKYKKNDSINCKILYNIFPKLTKKIVNELGEKPFHIRGPLNASLLDTVCSTLMSNYENIVDDISHAYEQLKNNENFNKLTSNSTTDSQMIKDRCSIIKKFLIKD